MAQPAQAEPELIYATPGEPPLARQAVSVLVHAALALGAWAGMMFVITLANPDFVPLHITLMLSAGIPLAVGFVANRWQQSRMAPSIWTLGVILLLIMGIWVLDQPTGPGHCFHCSADQRLWFSLFSFHTDSGLLDGDGRFLGTWPAAALIGYAAGARLGLHRSR